ncbi:hypothetical protein D3C81_2165180 [compost metagenome]
MFNLIFQGSQLGDIYTMHSLYDSTGKACLTLRALHEIIHITMVDIIANDYSISRGGTPAFLWEQGIKE